MSRKKTEIQKKQCSIRSEEEMWENLLFRNIWDDGKTRMWKLKTVRRSLGIEKNNGKMLLKTWKFVLKPCKKLQDFQFIKYLYNFHAKLRKKNQWNNFGGEKLIKKRKFENIFLSKILIRQFQLFYRIFNKFVWSSDLRPPFLIRGLK